MARAWDQRWTLGDRLGKGGQGFTYVATFVDDPTITGALKYLKNNRDHQARGRMRREVANLQSLANEGGKVPRVLDDNTSQSEDPKIELYVVMDLIHGRTLSEYIESSGPVTIDTALQFTLSLCKTIQIAGGPGLFPVRTGHLV